MAAKYQGQMAAMGFCRRRGERAFLVIFGGQERSMGGSDIVRYLYLCVSERS